jgi:L-fuculose-phosphate aldolase
MDNLNPFAVKKDICEVGRRMYAREFVAANDGNISVRIGPDRVIATPTLVSKGFMTPDMLVTVDLNGKVIEGSRKPSSELKLHLKVYRERSDVGAVVHAHPVTATGFAVAGEALDKAYMPELVVSLGSVRVAEYATPSTDEVPESISRYVKDHNAVLLANHGVLTWGRDLFEAYFRLETIESYAKILVAAKAVGKARLLPCEKMEPLMRIRESLGIRGAVPACQDAGPCPCGGAPERSRDAGGAPSRDLETIIERVTERVLAALKK